MVRDASLSRVSNCGIPRAGSNVHSQGNPLSNKTGQSAKHKMTLVEEETKLSIRRCSHFYVQFHQLTEQTVIKNLTEFNAQSCRTYNQVISLCVNDLYY